MGHRLLNKSNIKPSQTGASGSKPTITPAAPSLKEGIAGRKSLSGCRVLVVGDAYGNALLLTIYLKGKVKSVDTSETAHEAIKKIQKNKYDIVLCDMGLGGGMTGFDVEKEAKELSPAALFVFVTGGGREGFEKTFPGQEYPKLVIQKPYRKDAIFGFLEHLCDS